MGYFCIERAVLQDGASLPQRQTASQLHWIKRVIDKVSEEILSGKGSNRKDATDNDKRRDCETS